MAKSASRSKKKTRKTKKWSAKVNESSNAMDLENGVFKAMIQKKLHSL